jgi:hypothetical protein
LAQKRKNKYLTRGDANEWFENIYC